MSTTELEPWWQAAIPPHLRLDTGQPNHPYPPKESAPLLHDVEPAPDNEARHHSNEARGMLRVLREVGVAVTFEDRRFRCPRPWCDGVIPIDWKKLTFRCVGCGIRGRGLKGLHLVSKLLNVPVCEWETKNPYYGELGQCPSPYRRVLGKGKQIRVDLLPCGAKGCKHCGFHKLRTEIGHYGSKFLQADTAFITSGVPGERWDAMRHQAWRKGSDYLRCAQPDGTLNVFHTRRLYRGDREYPRFRDLATHEAETFWEMLVASISGANESDDHLSASDAWQRSKAIRQMAMEWEALGLTKLDRNEEGWEVLTHTRSTTDLLKASVEAGLLPEDTLDRPLAGRFLIEGERDRAAFDRLAEDYKILPLAELRAKEAEHRASHRWTPGDRR